MNISLSTRWNASRHSCGRAMLEEILALGFDTVELGYDLRRDLVPGVAELVKAGTVKVRSIHNFCPVPMGVSAGHPELYLLGSIQERVRETAVRETLRTAEFAAEMGATVVVVHAGRCDFRHLTPRLIDLAEDGQQFGATFDKVKTKLIVKREKRTARLLPCVKRSLDEILPSLEKLGVAIALENLPSWEAIPNESEMLKLAEAYNSPSLGYWHDIGHAQIRENLGFISQRRWLEKLAPYLKGVHVHDVQPPARDHVMPPRGEVDFGGLGPLLPDDAVRVFEPTPGTPEEDLVEARQFIEKAWGTAPPANEGDER